MGKGRNGAMVVLVHHIHLVRWLLSGHMQCSLWPGGNKLIVAVPEGESMSPDPVPTLLPQAGVNL